MDDFATIVDGATLTIEANNGSSGVLVLRVEGSKLNITGSLSFSGVSYIQMESSVSVRGAGIYDQACPDFLNVSVKDGARQYVVQGEDGTAHCVVAKTVEFKKST